MCTSGPGKQLGRILFQHTHAPNILALLSVIELLFYLGVNELPRTSSDQKKGQEASQHRGRLANGPDNLNKKIK